MEAASLTGESARTLWRICRAPFAAFDGEGARLYGGRWTPPGVRVVYTSGSLSLAALEFFVHVDTDLVPDDLVAVPAEIPSTCDQSVVEAADLPSDWRSYPAPEALQDIGIRWAESGESTVLSVPSAVVPEERNYLLNPEHPEFHRIGVGSPRAFGFDARMWR